MNIVALSDLHMGKESWKNRWENLFPRLSNLDIDILYFGGDLADSHSEFERALPFLEKIKAKHKLYVAGNHELYLHRGYLVEYPYVLQERIKHTGFKLLDLNPVIIDDIAFVGSVGWYDGSLWKPLENNMVNRYPNTLSGMKIYTEEFFGKAEKLDLIPKGYKNIDFFNFVQTRLKNHLKLVIENKQVSKVVLGLHCVPHPEFVLYNNNVDFNYANWFMGFHGAPLYDNPKMALGLIGHTHRHQVLKIHGVPIYNVSGWDQPTIIPI